MSTPPTIEVLITLPISADLLAQLRGISPRLNITVIPAGSAAEIPAETWAKTEVLYTAHILPNPEQVPALKWLQFHFAGVDRFLDEPLLQKDRLLITTLSGAAASQVAEYVLAMLLALSHKLPALLAAQKNRNGPKTALNALRHLSCAAKQQALSAMAALVGKLRACCGPLA